MQDDILQNRLLQSGPEQFERQDSAVNAAQLSAKNGSKDDGSENQRHQSDLENANVGNIVGTMSGAKEHGQNDRPNWNHLIKMKASASAVPAPAGYDLQRAQQFQQDEQFEDFIGRRYPFRLEGNRFRIYRVNSSKIYLKAAHVVLLRSLNSTRKFNTEFFGVRFLVVLFKDVYESVK